MRLCVDKIEDRMNRYGWTDIWHPAENSWYVGFYDRFDLCCVKRCDTEEEAENSMSPEGRTIDEAIVKAIRRLKQLGLSWEDTQNWHGKKGSPK